MKFVVTKSNTILGRLITWGLNEPVSHFSIVFDNKLVISSNLLGVHLSWFPTLMKSSLTMYEIEVPMDLAREEEIYQSIITSFDGAPYDFKQFFKFLWAGFKFKFFKIPIDTTKTSIQNNAYLCTEIIQVLPDWVVSLDTKQKTLGLVSPWYLFSVLATEIKNDLK